jgi:hypothetical protein
MIEWVSENREWVFSGIGVTAIVFVLAMFKQFLKKDKRYPVNKDGTNISISDKAIIQGSVAGRDLNIYHSTPKIFESNIPLERYRGNIQGKFIRLNRTIERAIKELKQRPQFAGAPSVEVQIEFLNTYHESVKNIEIDFFSALDSDDLIAAHEALNGLREIAMEHSQSLINHYELYVESISMSKEAGGFYGTYIWLEKTILNSLDPFYE